MQTKVIKKLMDIKKNMVLMNEQIGSLNRERNSKKKKYRNSRAENYNDWNQNWKPEIKDQRASEFSGRINRNDPI